MLTAERIACGIEIEHKFVDAAIRRWEKMTEACALLSCRKGREVWNLAL